MKVKTSELQGPALDWAVDKCEGHVRPDGGFYAGHQGRPITSYSTDTAQGGLIIDREDIDIQRCNDLYFPKGNEHGAYYEPYYKASKLGISCYGPTPSIAAMRCYVASKLGDEIEVPEGLV